MLLIVPTNEPLADDDDDDDDPVLVRELELDEEVP